MSGALESAGMALAVLYAQLTDDGLGIYDALYCAGNFDKACEKLVYKCWYDGGKAVYKSMKKHDGKSYQIKDVLPSYPNTRKHAEAFVKEVFKDYLNCTK